MPRNAYWTCTRVSAGVRCGAQNVRRAKKCGTCGKTRPAVRKTKHMTVLEQPYSVFLALNGGIERCGICGAEPGARRLHRDHDHRTGEPRGLLCFRCNAALRPYMDANWLLDAEVYVQRAIDRRAT